MFRVMSIRVIPLTLLMVAGLFFWTSEAGSESCIECHLHGSIVKDSGGTGAEVKTLAGFHSRVLIGERLESVCIKCHGDFRDINKLPAREVCTRCHTRGKVAQGEPSMVFHAEKEHWPMEKVSCAECHKGHVKGNPDIKFLTTDTISLCQRCHEKSFNLGKPL